MPKLLAYSNGKIINGSYLKLLNLLYHIETPCRGSRRQAASAPLKEHLRT
jgi:hypothetical protein